MNILSRLLARFGYVRLKDYGYALSPGGKIVEVVEVEDDRFAPPPWQPVAWQSASSLLPPAAKSPPAPRPLPLPPAPEADEAEAKPLFQVPAVPATVETAPPGKPQDEDYGINIDEVPEDEEWEWKMALARAREAAEKEKLQKDREKAPVRTARAMPLAPAPARKVVDSPRPMSRIARPEPRISAARPVAEKPIARVEPRPATDQPVAARTTPRTVPPKAPPPGRSSRPLAAAAPPAEAPKSASRQSLEKSVSRVFSPPTPSAPAPAAGKPRPIPRLARGTESPASAARPTRPQLAQGSSRLPAVRDPSQDITATDITAVDRAEASMRGDDEDTRVNLVVAPSAEITLDEPEVEATMVDGKPNGVAIVSVENGTPLPRLTARLRRHSVPN